ncbi:SidA/IucD/PvdA family monooxygenase [Acinetobacter baumannii]
MSGYIIVVSVQMPTDVTLAGHHQLQYAELLENQKTKLCFEHRQQNKNYILEADCVIAATGYRYRNPKFLQNLQSLIIRDQADHVRAGWL